MAKTTIVQLVDDIDGKTLNEDDAEQVGFSLDGRSYSFDLSKKNADKFRGLFQDYITVATKVGGSGRRGSTPRTKSNAAVVRAWARDNGYDVPERGRIPKEVQDAFDAK